MPSRNGEGIELLSDPTRRAIVVAICATRGGPEYGLEPAKIAKHIGRSRQATSRQLRILHKAGLLKVRKGFVDGRRRNYYMDARTLGRITVWLAGTEVARALPNSPQHEVPVRDGDAA